MSLSRVSGAKVDCHWIHGTRIPRLLFTLTEIPFGVALGAGVAVNLHGAIRIECESFGVSMELHDISTPALDV